MEHFQNKIRLMREVIDTIKVDIETIRARKTTLPLKMKNYIMKPHSSYKRKVNKNRNISNNNTNTSNANANDNTNANQYSYQCLKTENNNTNSTYNTFKSHCPIKKEQTQINLTYSSKQYHKNSNRNINSSQPYIINQNKDSSEITKPIANNTQFNVLDYSKEIAKIPELINETNRNQRDALNDYNYKGNYSRKQYKYNRNEPMMCFSSDMLQVQTEPNIPKSERRILSSEHIHSDMKPQHLYSNSNAKQTLNNHYKVLEYKEIVDKLIMVSQKYNTNNHYNDNENHNEVSYHNVVQYYQNSIEQLKQKNDLINSLLQLLTSTTGLNISNEKDFHLILYNWIKALSTQETNRSNTNTKRNMNHSERNEYQYLCQRIMKQYNLRNITEFTVFLDDLLKKADKNECFIEGITNILLSNNKNKP